MKTLSEIIKENNNFGIVIETNSKKNRTSSPTLKPRTKSKGIQKHELDMMAESIKTVFGTEAFMNRDFAPKGLLEKWNLSNRQTPPRLKKLVQMGILEDLGGSTKSYKVVS